MPPIHSCVLWPLVSSILLNALPTFVNMPADACDTSLNMFINSNGTWDRERLVGFYLPLGRWSDHPPNKKFYGGFAWKCISFVMMFPVPSLLDLRWVWRLNVLIRVKRLFDGSFRRRYIYIDVNMRVLAQDEFNWPT